jgi:mono/diheme cytochrome c family protein
VLGAAGALLLLAGCHTDMWVQPRVKPYDSNDFFANGQGLRPLVAHTVDRNHFWTDSARYTGYVGNKMVDTFPIKIEKADILRGQERFNIFCSPCHGELGNGQGMIAQRGLALRRQPGNYHTDRLRKMPIGHFYDVITNGYGVMYSYAARVEPDDRWRIAAYIRVLQRSQNARPTDLPADLPADVRHNLETGAPATQPTVAPGTGNGPTVQPGAEPGANQEPGAKPGEIGNPPSNRPSDTSPVHTGAPAGQATPPQTPTTNGTNANGH